MTKQEFLEKYNYAPYEFKEVAELLSTITDAAEVVSVAIDYLEARENLELVLDKIGFEFG